MEKVQDKLMQQLQSIDKVYEEYAKSKGMTYLTLVVLEEIYEIGAGCTQKQISEETHYPKQTINVVVKSFLKDGYVELREMPENRKNKEICLTAKGRKLCREVVEPLLASEKQAIDGMGAEQSQELVRLLDLYCNRYCDEIKHIMD